MAKSKKIRLAESSSTTNVPVDKKRLFVSTVVQNKQEFRVAFDGWYRSLQDSPNLVKDSELGCLLSRGAKFPKNGRLFLCTKAYGKCQVKVARWVQEYWPENKADFSNLKMSLGQFLLLGLYTEEVEILFGNINPNTKKYQPRGCFTDGGRLSEEMAVYDASHLCNEAACMNVRHIVCDPYWVNREARRACPGPASCTCDSLDHRLPDHLRERYKCLCPGPLYSDWKNKF
jgi:hypothetical protein